MPRFEGSTVRDGEKGMRVRRQTKRGDQFSVGGGCFILSTGTVTWYIAQGQFQQFGPLNEVITNCDDGCSECVVSIVNGTETYFISRDEDTHGKYQHNSSVRMYLRRGRLCLVNDQFWRL